MQVLLQRYSRCEDIVVGVPFAGRDVEETQRLVGFFVNVLPLRTTLEVGASVNEGLNSRFSCMHGVSTRVREPLARYGVSASAPAESGTHARPHTGTLLAFALIWAKVHTGLLRSIVGSTP